MKKIRLILLLQVLFLSSNLVYAQDEALSAQLISYDNNGKFYEQFLFPSANGLLYSVYNLNNEVIWKFRVLGTDGAEINSGIVPLPDNSSFVGSAENDEFIFFIFTAKINKKASFALLSINKNDNELTFKAYPYSESFDLDLDLLNTGFSYTGIVMEFGIPRAFYSGYFVYLSFEGKIKEFDSDSLVRLTPCVINKCDLGPAFAYYNEVKKDNRICLISMNEMEEFVVKETEFVFNGSDEVPNYFSNSGTIIRYAENEYFIAIPQFESDTLTATNKESLTEDNEQYKFKIISIKKDEIIHKVVSLDEDIKNIKYSKAIIGGSINYLLFSGFIDTPEGYAIAIEKINCDANLSFNSTSILGRSIKIENAKYISTQVILINHQFNIEYKTEIEINLELKYSDFMKLVDNASTFDYSNLIRISQLFVNNSNLFLGFMKGGKLQITRLESDGNQDNYLFNTAPENYTVNPFEKITYYQGEDILFVKQYANKKIKSDEKLFYLINSYNLK